MSWQLTKNLAASTLASSYTAGDSSITVQSGDGAKFPTSGDFMLAFNDPPDFFLKCTARSTDTLTVVTSGSEGSTAIDEGSSVKVTQVITAGVLSDLLAAAGGSILSLPVSSAPSPDSTHVQLYGVLAGKSAVPVMTGATAPSGDATASSNYSTTPPWAAFAPAQNGWLTNG